MSSIRGRCYQMDADAPGNRFSWSTQMLDALGVQPARLAAVVYVQAEVAGRQETMMVPAEPSDTRTPEQPLTVEVVPGTAFDRILITIDRATDGAVIVPNFPLPGVWFPANQVVRIPLPRDLPRGVPLRLRVAGEHARGFNPMDQLFWLPR